MLFMCYTCPSLALCSVLFLGCIAVCCCDLRFVWVVWEFVCWFTVHCVCGLLFIVVG